MNIFARFIYFFNFKRKWKLRKTDYGRSEGWEVYLGENKVAELLEPKYIEMFWVSYKLARVEPSYLEEIKTMEFWDQKSLKFKSKAIGEFANGYPFFTIPENALDDQIYARGLYFIR